MKVITYVIGSMASALVGYGCVANSESFKTEDVDNTNVHMSSLMSTTTYVTLDTVVIVGTADFHNIYADGGTASLDAVLASPYYSRTRMESDVYSEYLAFVADAKTNPFTTPDVRCNNGATSQTKNTTSQASVTDRFLAAQQLFAYIRGIDNAMSLRALTRDGATYFYNGAKQFTFRVTYADGGKEAWIVASILTGALVNEGNVPNSLTSGNGTVQSCPGTRGDPYGVNSEERRTQLLGPLSRHH